MHALEAGGIRCVPARLMNLVSSAQARTNMGIGGSYLFPRVVHHSPGPDSVDRMGLFILYQIAGRLLVYVE